MERLTYYRTYFTWDKELQNHILTYCGVPLEVESTGGGSQAFVHRAKDFHLLITDEGCDLPEVGEEIHVGFYNNSDKPLLNKDGSTMMLFTYDANEALTFIRNKVQELSK